MKTLEITAVNQIETFNEKATSFAANRASSASYYESIRVRKWHALFIAEAFVCYRRIWRSICFTSVKWSPPLLVAICSRNVSMRSIMLRARARVLCCNERYSAPRLYTQDIRDLHRNFDGEYLSSANRRGAPRRYYQKASTIRQSEFDILLA